jgi:hypothetical protein
MAKIAPGKRTNFDDYVWDENTGSTVSSPSSSSQSNNPITVTSPSSTRKTTSIIDDNGEKQTGYVDTGEQAAGSGLTYKDFLEGDGYDAGTNYKYWMDQAADAKDYIAAALLEQKRNRKIKGEELADYGLTYDYHNPEVVVPDNTAGQGGTYYDGMLSVLQEQLQAAKDANDASSSASIQQAINELNAQKEALTTQYDDLAKQFYIDRRLGEKNLPQQLAALGYSGGLTESSMLGLLTNYQQALAENEQSRAQSYSDIAQQIASAQLTGELSRAQTEQELAQNYFSNYASVVQALQEQANWDRQFGYQQQQDEESAQRTAQQDALTVLNWKLNNGYEPTAEEWAAARITLPAETETYGNQGGYNANTVATQNDLKTAGYLLEADGVWGPQTKAAWDDYNNNGGRGLDQYMYYLDMITAMKYSESSDSEILKRIDEYMNSAILDKDVYGNALMDAMGY